MDSQILVLWPFFNLLCFVSVVLVMIQPSLANPELYQNCSRLFHCGRIEAGFPFWGEDRSYGCGHPDLHLNCDNDKATMMIEDLIYSVLDVDQQAKVLKIARQDYFEGLCPQLNTTIYPFIFYYYTGYQMLTLYYGCPINHSQSTCFLKDVNYMNGFFQTGTPGCNLSVSIPISETLLSAAKLNKRDLEEALEQGFEVKWKLNPCVNCSSCGYDITRDRGICYCSDGQISNSAGCSASTPAQTPKGSPESPGSYFEKKKNIFIGLVATVVGIIVTLAILLIVGLSRYRKKTIGDEQNVEAFITNYESLAPKRYNYSDIKTMTKSFSHKLGQGGYGDVYKGKLPNGRLVAVKVLKGSKGNGEEFINEVASTSRTSHVNIVTFLGFCYEKKKRALIYEFMPNGSLDKYIYDQESSSMNCKLELRTMYQVAIGIARGLEYLHRGCNIRIVHFDIKPHNILLDENFCPKISDFGLSKQSKKKESIISMLNARGTIGYIAPEVYCRSFGGVSYKSDVYSYGMMILEMVGGRKKVDIRLSHSSEIYFPDSIYKHLEPGNDFKLDGVVTQEEKDMAKKMLIVSLWCIQTNPSHRPSIDKVLEMLESGLENLQIPPKPSLSSPRRSVKQFAQASSSTEHVSQENRVSHT